MFHRVHMRQQMEEKNGQEASHSYKSKPRAVKRSTLTVNGRKAIPTASTADIKSKG